MGGKKKKRGGGGGGGEGAIHPAGHASNENNYNRRVILKTEL